MSVNMGTKMLEKMARLRDVQRMQGTNINIFFEISS